ncbi:2OG-Fe(II) oxygenase [Hyphomicrobium sp. D-2]|uniref:2OG-Fe(II) oxygenase n=1 Tax=Hyphomicrobium sp. D-2 TaxID=3041621 RepID=UPI002458E983|nr:2OG-Fe(II) oxygenase [Hyphomicrobium sp. D-2]MDH4981746.1 2OG-Fe(II) oxygenase [Hyphomicrobium sp. D-2]
MSASAKDVAASLLRSFRNSNEEWHPYRHWFLQNCLPQSTVDDILDLPISAADLGGVSGKRELHNASRHYFDVGNRAEYACAESVAAALQDPRVTAEIERTFGVRLSGTYLRIEFAQDVDGFWLEPHTDIGVKAFTFLLYLSKDPTHSDLGTDIYDAEKRWVGRSPFGSNSAMIFVPSNISYHGFEARPINGVRKSLVINYVTDAWRAREQLSYPEQPVSVAAATFA